MEHAASDTLTPLEWALFMAALADGRSCITCAGLDSRSRRLIDALEGLGVTIRSDDPGHRIEVTGTGGYWPNSDAVLHVGRSLPLVCLLTGACAVGRGDYVVRSELPAASLDPFWIALSDLRAVVTHEETEDGLLIRTGPESVKGGTLWLARDCPSTILQTILLIAPYCAGDIMIASPDTADAASTQLCRLMELFNVPVIEEAGRFIVPAPQRYRARDLAVNP